MSQKHLPTSLSTNRTPSPSAGSLQPSTNPAIYNPTAAGPGETAYEHPRWNNPWFEQKILQELREKITVPRSAGEADHQQMQRSHGKPIEIRYNHRRQWTACVYRYSEQQIRSRKVYLPGQVKNFGEGWIANDIWNDQVNPPRVFAIVYVPTAELLARPNQAVGVPHGWSLR